MNKIYITDDNGVTKAFAYKYENNHVTSIELSEDDILKILSFAVESKISHIEEYEKSLQILIHDDIEINVDSLEPFKREDGKLSELLHQLAVKIVNYHDKEKLQQLSSRPNKPSVNRTKSKNLGRRIMALSLTGAIILAGAKYIENNKSKKEKPSKPLINTEQIAEIKKPEMTQNLATMENKIDKALEETSKTTINLPINFVDVSKKESTIDFLGDIIYNYSVRYGIPYDVACLYITQERPLIIDGHVDNPCQLTNFVGAEFSVPVYNKDGPTGEVEHFKVTQDMIDNTDTNIKIGLAYLRYCIDRCDSLMSGLFCYNQGPFALSLACDYYGLDINEYKGDSNAIKARDLIVKYFKEKNINTGRVHGDPNYLENVFRYMNSEERNAKNFEYFLGNKKKVIAINPTLEYTNDFEGGRYV